MKIEGGDGSPRRKHRVKRSRRVRRSGPVNAAAEGLGGVGGAGGPYQVDPATEAVVRAFFQGLVDRPVPPDMPLECDAEVVVRAIGRRLYEYWLEEREERLEEREDRRRETEDEP